MSAQGPVIFPSDVRKLVEGVIASVVACYEHAQRQREAHEIQVARANAHSDIDARRESCQLNTLRREPPPAPAPPMQSAASRAEQSDTYKEQRTKFKADKQVLARAKRCDAEKRVTAAEAARAAQGGELPEGLVETGVAIHALTPKERNVWRGRQPVPDAPTHRTTKPGPTQYFAFVESNKKEALQWERAHALERAERAELAVLAELLTLLTLQRFVALKPDDPAPSTAPTATEEAAPAQAEACAHSLPRGGAAEARASSSSQQRPLVQLQVRTFAGRTVTIDGVDLSTGAAPLKAAIRAKLGWWAGTSMGLSSMDGQCLEDNTPLTHAGLVAGSQVRLNGMLRGGARSKRRRKSGGYSGETSSDTSADVEMSEAPRDDKASPSRFSVAHRDECAAAELLASTDSNFMNNVLGESVAPCSGSGGDDDVTKQCIDTHGKALLQQLLCCVLAVPGMAQHATDKKDHVSLGPPATVALLRMCDSIEELKCVKRILAVSMARARSVGFEWSDFKLHESLFCKVYLLDGRMEFHLHPGQSNKRSSAHALVKVLCGGLKHKCAGAIKEWKQVDGSIYFTNGAGEGREVTRTAANLTTPTLALLENALTMEHEASSIEDGLLFLSVMYRVESNADGIPEGEALIDALRKSNVDENNISDAINHLEGHVLGAAPHALPPELQMCVNHVSGLSKNELFQPPTREELLAALNSHARDNGDASLLQKFLARFLRPPTDERWIGKSPFALPGQLVGVLLNDGASVYACGLGLAGHAIRMVKAAARGAADDLVVRSTEAGDVSDAVEAAWELNPQGGGESTWEPDVHVVGPVLTYLNEVATALVKGLLARRGGSSPENDDDDILEQCAFDGVYNEENWARENEFRAPTFFNVVGLEALYPATIEWLLAHLVARSDHVPRNRVSDSEITYGQVATQLREFLRHAREEGWLVEARNIFEGNSGIALKDAKKHLGNTISQWLQEHGKDDIIKAMRIVGIVLSGHVGGSANAIRTLHRRNFRHVVASRIGAEPDVEALMASALSLASEAALEGVELADIGCAPHAAAISSARASSSTHRRTIDWERVGARLLGALRDDLDRAVRNIATLRGALKEKGGLGTAVGTGGFWSLVHDRAEVVAAAVGNIAALRGAFKEKGGLGTAVGTDGFWSLVHDRAEVVAAAVGNIATLRGALKEKGGLGTAVGTDGFWSLVHDRAEVVAAAVGNIATLRGALKEKGGLGTAVGTGGFWSLVHDRAEVVAAAVGNIAALRGAFKKKGGLGTAVGTDGFWSLVHDRAEVVAAAVGNIATLRGALKEKGGLGTAVGTGGFWSLVHARAEVVGAAVGNIATLRGAFKEKGGLGTAVGTGGFWSLVHARAEVVGAAVGNIATLRGAFKKKGGLGTAVNTDGFWSLVHARAEVVAAAVGNIATLRGAFKKKGGLGTAVGTGGFWSLVHARAEVVGAAVGNIATLYDAVKQKGGLGTAVNTNGFWSLVHDRAEVVGAAVGNIATLYDAVKENGGLGTAVGTDGFWSLVHDGAEVVGAAVGNIATLRCAVGKEGMGKALGTGGFWSAARKGRNACAMGDRINAVRDAIKNLLNTEDDVLASAAFSSNSFWSFIGKVSVDVDVVVKRIETLRGDARVKLTNRTFKSGSFWHVISMTSVNLDVVVKRIETLANVTGVGLTKGTFGRNSFWSLVGESDATVAATVTCICAMKEEVGGSLQKSLVGADAVWAFTRRHSPAEVHKIASDIRGGKPVSFSSREMRKYFGQKISPSDAPAEHGAGGGEGQPNEAPQAPAFNTAQAVLAASAQAAAAETELVRLKLEVHETLHGMMDSDEITIEQKDVIGFAISRLASRRPDDNEPWYLRMMHRLFVSKPHPLARQMLILRGQLNDLHFSAPLGSIP